MIVRAAFGEAERGEQAFVDEMVRRDPAAKALFDEFAAMRTGLRGLDDVPACQLSTDRLRQAILAQGVKPGRTTVPFRLTWGHGLAAAACLAVGMVFLRQPAADQVRVASDVTPPAATSAKKAEQSQPVATAPLATAPKRPELLADSAPVEHPAAVNGLMDRAVPKPSHRRVRTSRPTGQAIAAPPFEAGLSKDAMAPTTMSLKAEGSGEETDARPTVADATVYDASVPEGPVVIVQPQTDPRTGAALAVESDHASDIVFGG